MRNIYDLNEQETDLLRIAEIAKENSCNIDFKTCDDLLGDDYETVDEIEQHGLYNYEHVDDFSDHEKNLEYLSFEDKSEDYDFSMEYHNQLVNNLK